MFVSPLPPYPAKNSSEEILAPRVIVLENAALLAVWGD